MGMWALDGDLLRTFVAVVDSGGFGEAALRRHITQSTVSQQMKRLEEQVGRGLFAAAGRRRVLTGDGELLCGYARRILALQDSAELALRDGQAGGVVRIGAVQDFAEADLAAALRAFARLHPRVRLEVRVGVSHDLRAMVGDARLDLAIVFDDPRAPAGAPLWRERACWLAGTGFTPPAPGEPWPLALFEPPCVFREAALRALDSREVPWRVAYSSPSLVGIRAAVRAGLAITARLPSGQGAGTRILGGRDGLPALGRFRVALVTSAEPLSPAASALAAALRTGEAVRARDGGRRPLDPRTAGRR